MIFVLYLYHLGLWQWERGSGFRWAKSYVYPILLWLNAAYGHCPSSVVRIMLCDGLIDKIRGQQVPTWVPGTLRLSSLSYHSVERSRYLKTASGKLFFTLSINGMKMTHIVQTTMNKTALQIKTKYYTHCPGYLEKPIQALSGKSSTKGFQFS